MVSRDLTSMAYKWLLQYDQKEAVMRKTISKFSCLSLTLSLLAIPATAQDDTPIETLNSPETQKKRVVRVVEAIPLWVDAQKLRVRDNPYAGDVVGMLEMGQKVKIYDIADNWIRISANGKPSKWVNRDFLSKTRVSWSNYEFGSRSRSTLNSPLDVELKRIKIKELKHMKIYAANIKPLSSNGHVIITRHDFRSGPYYEKRLVLCNGKSATHVTMLGEGYNYSMMEQDPRNARISTPANPNYKIDANTTRLNAGIAKFTCKVKDL